MATMFRPKNWDVQPGLFATRRVGKLVYLVLPDTGGQEFNLYKLFDDKLTFVRSFPTKQEALDYVPLIELEWVKTPDLWHTMYNDECVAITRNGRLWVLRGHTYATPEEAAEFFVWENS